LCSQRAATPAVGVASGCQNERKSCCRVSGLPQVATQCNAGTRVQIPGGRIADRRVLSYPEAH
jgi:hypothetical protein